jgi:hypothetical protein
MYENGNDLRSYQMLNVVRFMLEQVVHNFNWVDVSINTASFILNM